MIDNLKDRIYDTLDFEKTADSLEWAVTIFLIGLILVNVVVAILDTVQELNQFRPLFNLIEAISLAIFTIEYGLRAWSITVNPKHAEPLRGRLLYLLTPMALIDFVAIFPSYIALYTGIATFDRSSCAVSDSCACSVSSNSDGNTMHSRLFKGSSSHDVPSSLWCSASALS